MWLANCGWPRLRTASGVEVEREGANVTSPGPRTGPTVRRILLGAQLRRLREAAGATRAEAGQAIRASQSKISRMELGRVTFKKRDVADLLTLYGVTDDGERDTLLGLARRANEPSWWHSYNDLLPSWFESYVALEEAATRIRTYEVQFIPGLLQTAGYARAVIAKGNEDSPRDDIERRVHLRMSRAQLLTRPDPPRVWAVIDEAALRRPIGGRQVMRTQLEHLVTAAALPNITLQVMPFRLGGHAAEGGAFSILRFPEEDLPDVVYIEQLTRALYLDARADVDHYARAMEQLCVQAADPNASTDIIAKVLAET